MRVIITIGSALLQLLYNIYKLAPVRKRIVMISRQSDEPNVDFRLLEERIHRDMPEYEVAFLCMMVENHSPLAYGWHMISRQMWYMATSEAVVLDTYCIAASLLNHRKELQILQIWHALGAFKKFSRSILDQKEGRSSRVANLMRMHRGYDRILASSEASVAGLSEAYGYGPEAFAIIPLPRVDLLRSLSYREEKRAELLAKNPALSGKTNILYAPTFRKTALEEDMIRELIDSIDYERFNLIVSFHPIVKERMRPDDRVIVLDGVPTMDLLSVADYFISDYSAVIFEAAAAGKPIFFYDYDIEQFDINRGFYLNPYRDLPNDPMRTAEEVLEAIRRADDAAKGAAFPGYDGERLSRFTEKYIRDLPDCTGAVVQLLQDMIREA